ncbi:MAG: hypothetical protein RBU30_20380, partial [Polyangia bacterium]|nr:hypothetical protein [Polyangia bacterium]
MKSGKSTSAKARFRDLGELARQSNHLVAAAVLVFMASVLLQFLLARPMMQAAGWIHGNWGKAGAAILGPLLTDGCTTLVLLAVAFPFGRVTAARPWPAGVALVLLVHGFWFCFHFVVGEHTLLWGNLMPALGRSLLIVLTLLGVVALLRWGRKVAL